MKEFNARFKQFYIKEGRELLASPSATALFKREVHLLFDSFRKYLVGNDQSTRGLKIKDFKRMLESEGFILVTNKR